MGKISVFLAVASIVSVLRAVESEKTPGDTSADTSDDVSVRAIAAQAFRAAAAKSAQANADWERSVRESAARTAQATAANYVKEAVATAAKEAATAAAKAAAAKTAELVAEGNTAKAEKKAERRQIDSRVFRLENASAEEVAENLNTMWSGEFGENWKVTKIAIAFPESNSILVTAPRLILDACEKAVRELDVEAPQVYIEARFVELGNSASHRVGIDWSMLDGMDLSVNMDGGYKSFDLGRGVSDYKYSEGEGTTKRGATSYTLTGNTGSGSSDATIGFFNGTLSLSQMKMTIQALDRSGDTKTFSNPKIIVSSGKKATVDMTTKYPNVKVSAKRTTGTTDSLDLASEMVAIPGEDKFMFAKEAFFSWGISLDVTPRISTNGLINVSIVPTISSLEDWVDTGTQSDADSGTVSAKYPQIKVQRLITEFKLASGTTAVIGGLSVTEEMQADSGIPVLRDIPWIGPRLFGSKTRVKEQKEIIVFVTVGLVNPREVHANAGLPKNAVLGRQYAEGQKLELGDRPEKNMEGFDSLDMRPLEEQAKDPLNTRGSGFDFGDFVPFRRDENYKLNMEKQK